MTLAQILAIAVSIIEAEGFKVWLTESYADTNTFTIGGDYHTQTSGYNRYFYGKVNFEKSLFTIFEANGDTLQVVKF
jgi:hypothetical protein